MGCNCKNNKKTAVGQEKQSEEKRPLIIRGILLVSKTFIFIIASILTSVIITPYAIYMLFKVIFLNEGTDVTQGLLTIGKMIKKKGSMYDDDYDDDDDEFEFENEDDLILMDSEEISK